MGKEGSGGLWGCFRDVVGHAIQGFRSGQGPIGGGGGGPAATTAAATAAATTVAVAVVVAALVLWLMVVFDGYTEPLTGSD